MSAKEAQKVFCRKGGKIFSSFARGVDLENDLYEEGKEGKLKLGVRSDNHRNIQGWKERSPGSSRQRRRSGDGFSMQRSQHSLALLLMTIAIIGPRYQGADEKGGGNDQLRHSNVTQTRGGSQHFSSVFFTFLLFSFPPFSVSLLL